MKYITTTDTATYISNDITARGTVISDEQLQAELDVARDTFVSTGVNELVLRLAIPYKHDPRFDGVLSVAQQKKLQDFDVENAEPLNISMSS